MSTTTTSILVASGPGRVTFEVQAEWSSIRVRDCGTFELHSPSRIASFGDGVYLVPSELAPERTAPPTRAADAMSTATTSTPWPPAPDGSPSRYRPSGPASASAIAGRSKPPLTEPPSPRSATASTSCLPNSRRERTAPPTRAADAASTATTSTSWRPAPDESPSRYRPSGPASGSAIAGPSNSTHRAASPPSATASTSCPPRSRRERTAPPTRAADAMSTATTSTSWPPAPDGSPSRYRPSGPASASAPSIRAIAGRRNPLTEPRLASFGDGVYLVPSEVAPGTYRAADTGSRCDVYRDNVHLVASGPGRVTFEVQAEWSSIRVRDCGTFELQLPEGCYIARRPG